MQRGKGYQKTVLFSTIFSFLCCLPYLLLFSLSKSRSARTPVKPDLPALFVKFRYIVFLHFIEPVKLSVGIKYEQEKHQACQDRFIPFVSLELSRISNEVPFSKCFHANTSKKEFPSPEAQSLPDNGNSH